MKLDTITGQFKYITKIYLYEITFILTVARCHEIIF